MAIAHRRREALDIEPDASGHAIEARLYAESPAKGFLPSAGKLLRLRFPENVRIDAGVEEGDIVPVHYDPMVAKLIAHGPTREAARCDLIHALERTEIAGIEHNAGYLRNLLTHPDFVAGDYGTHLAEAIHDAVTLEPEDSHWVLAALAAVSDGPGPWSRSDGWRVNLPPRIEVILRQGGDIRTVRIYPGRVEIGDASFKVEGLGSGARALVVRLNGDLHTAGLLRDGRRHPPDARRAKPTFSNVCKTRRRIKPTG